MTYLVLEEYGDFEVLGFKSVWYSEDGFSPKKTYKAFIKEIGQEYGGNTANMRAMTTLFEDYIKERGWRELKTFRISFSD